MKSDLVFKCFQLKFFDYKKKVFSENFLKKYNQDLFENNCFSNLKISKN